jgi:low affinity Fe/Cu permease
VLGPILFLIYVNDLSSVCCGNTVLQLFADDAKLYSNIGINDSAPVSLQQSLEELTHWAKEWQLTINTSKCLVLSVSIKPEPVRVAYYINSSPVHLFLSKIPL